MGSVKQISCSLRNNAMVCWGYSSGLGLQLALACTLRMVSSQAKLGLLEIDFGFFPSMGAAQRLTRLVGEGEATEDYKEGISALIEKRKLVFKEK